MARPQAPHGTEAAFKRHRRDGETPCQRCEEAHRATLAGRRNDYRSQRIETSTEPPAAPPVAPQGPASAPVKPDDGERVRDLKETRDTLKRAIDMLAEREPWKIPALSKELRETWREIASLEDDDAGTEDEFSEFDLDGDGTNVTRFPAAQDRETA